MRTDWIFKESLGHVLAALEPANRLVLEVSMCTGLRLSDVLNIRSEQIAGAKAAKRITVTERKTGKRRTVWLSRDLLERMRMESGRKYVFEGRLDWQKPRTRQAVWKDLKRAAWRFRCKANIAPHSCRKVWAVEEYHRTHDLKRVQGLLNHSSEAVTMLYAMADQITERKMQHGRKANNGEAGNTGTATV